MSSETSQQRVARCRWHQSWSFPVLSSDSFPLFVHADPMAPEGVGTGQVRHPRRPSKDYSLVEAQMIAECPSALECLHLAVISEDHGLFKGARQALETSDDSVVNSLKAEQNSVMVVNGGEVGAGSAVPSFGEIDDECACSAEAGLQYGSGRRFWGPGLTLFQRYRFEHRERESQERGSVWRKNYVEYWGCVAKCGSHDLGFNGSSIATGQSGAFALAGVINERLKLRPWTTESHEYVQERRYPSLPLSHPSTE